MPRLVNFTDEGWLTIGMRATTDIDNISDPLSWIRDACRIFEQIAALPEAQLEVPDPGHDVVQAEEQLAAARATIETLTNRLLAGPAPHIGVATARPATVPLPDAFEGDLTAYLDFKTKLNNKFRADAPTFRNEQHCLSVAVSLLKKGAADIMRPYLREDRIDLTDITEFWEVLDRAFDDPDRKGTAERNLRALRQGKREFAHYFADFMRLKADVEWNDAACIDALRTGCAQEIRDVLRVQLTPLPLTLQPVADLFNRIDLQNRQWLAESSKAPAPTTAPPKKPLVAPVVPASQRTTSNPAWVGPAPMDLSGSNRTAARNAARAARRAKAMAEGLCFTCSSPEHNRANCPIQAQYDQARALRAAATTDSTATTTEDTGTPSQPAEN